MSKLRSHETNWLKTAFFAILAVTVLTMVSCGSGGGGGTTGGSSGLPALVTLISPLDGETGVPITPTLSWNISAGATSYNVYFGTLSTPPFVLTTTGTTHVPGTLLYNTSYYWQINSENDVGVVTGTIWTFQTKPNTAPVLVSPGDKTVNEGQNLTFTLSATDVDGNTITYSGTNMPSGATLDTNTGVFDWTPGYTQNGIYNVTFTASDSLLTNSKPITITVNDIDMPPVLVSPGDKSVNENQLLTFTLVATDPDNDTIAYSAVGLPSGATLISNTGVFSWTPNYTQSGVFTVTFTATANLLTDSETINITVGDVDQAPVLTTPGNKTVDEGQNLTFTLSATDPDVADTIVYSMTNTPTGATLNKVTGVFNWTPGYAQSGNYSVTFIATANLLSDSKSITITVSNIDRPPVLVSPGDKTVDEGQNLTFTLSATDPDVDTMVYSAVGMPTGASLISSTGVFNWTPGYDQANTYVITFTVTTNSLSDSQTITVTVNDMDRAPVLTSPGDQTIDEGQNLNFALSATDPDGDLIAYSIAGTPTGATFNEVTGVFDWTPDYSQANTYEITFTATANLLSDSVTITITVADANGPPVLTSPGDQTVDEDQNLTFTLSAIDPESDPITYSAVGLPTGATLNENSGVFDWTPGFDQANTYNVTFTATANLLIDSVEIVITVNNVDRAPVLTSPGDKIVDEGQNLTFTLSATDPDGDNATYSGTNMPAGAVLDANTGVFDWTPDFDQANIYTVTFTATTNLLSDYEAITITVNHVDRAPSFLSLTDKQVYENNSLVFTVAAIDPDGDPVTYSIAALPGGASFNESSGSFAWIPGFDQAGFYPVTFTAHANTLTTSAPITITVINVNRPPTLDPVSNYTIDENTTITITLSATDPDGDLLKYLCAGLPFGATFVTQTGIFVWTPTYYQASEYYIIFRVIDSGGAVDEKTSIITVVNVPVPLVETYSASNILATTAVLNGRVNPSGQETTAYFEYGETTSYGITTTLKSVGDGTSDIYINEVITGLSPSTSYNFRIVATNATGTSYGSNQVFGTTSQEPLIYSSYATNVLATSVRLMGEVNPNNLDTDVYFEYGLSDSFGITTTAQAIGNGSVSVWISEDLTGLTSTTMYFFRLAATNSVGTSYSSTGIFETTSEFPIISYVYPSNIVSSAVRLQANVNPNGVETNVYLEYGLDENYGSSTAEQSIGSGTDYVTLSVDIDALTETTVYYYKLVAYNSAGTSDMTGQFITTEALMPEVIDYGVFNLTTSSARLGGWVNPRGLDTTVYFEWGTSITYTETTSSQLIGSGIDTVYVYVDLTDLFITETYNFRVVAYNSGGTIYTDNFVFNTTTDIFWIQDVPDGTPGLPPARQNQLTVWDGDEMIMFGGYVFRENAMWNDLWFYYPLTSTWVRQIANNTLGSPKARYSASMVWDEEKAILFGGYDWTNDTYLNDLWWYYPITNTWVEMIANKTDGSPSGRYGHQMVWDGTRVILFAGINRTSFVNDLWWYDPVSNTWEQKIDNDISGSPGSRVDFSLVYDGDKVIMFGGSYMDIMNDLWWYDPLTNEWTEKIAQDEIGSPIPRSGHSMVSFGTTCMMFGGNDWFGSVNDLWQYNSDTNVWINIIEQNIVGSPMPRYAHSMVFSGDDFIMYGGIDYDNSIWRLIP